uniref:Uncharacterized protein n=1 Tax=Rousettus aegyptiacus TaxID=9407 RepID=A0A7J8HSH2_ROUAE|nr:hypothetical protein HJG63_011080 [Rousettus aegyptiacus]
MVWSPTTRGTKELQPHRTTQIYLENLMKQEKKRLSSPTWRLILYLLDIEQVHWDRWHSTALLFPQGWYMHHEGTEQGTEAVTRSCLSFPRTWALHTERQFSQEDRGSLPSVRKLAMTGSRFH